jgi:hypothetical protein
VSPSLPRSIDGEVDAENDQVVFRTFGQMRCSAGTGFRI